MKTRINVYNLRRRPGPAARPSPANLSTLRAGLAAAATVIGLATAPAAPLQPADVPRQPAWLLHWDLDAFRQTSIGRQILTELEKEEHRKKLEAFKAMFRFDPRTALHGLTLYSTTKAQEDGVLLVYADVDAAQLTALAQAAKDHQTLNHRNHTVHHWIDEKRPPKDGVPARTYAAIYQSRIVIFGQRAERVMEALDVLDRLKPNLLLDAQLVQALPRDAFLVGLARGGALSEQDPQGAVFRQSRLMRLGIRESNQHLQGQLTLETDNEEIAVQVENIARGLVGLLALQQDRPGAQWLARTLQIQRTGATITVGLTVPVQDILDRIRASAQNPNHQTAANNPG